MNPSPDLDDAIGALAPETVALLGGAEYEVGWYDGVVEDAARGRAIPYRVRYPKGYAGPAATVVFSPGGEGDLDLHRRLPHFGTALARFGFIAINVAHAPSASEARHRFDRPVDVSLLLDELAELGAPAPRVRERPLLPEECRALPDVRRVGVIGHSFGAYTAHALAGVEHAPVFGVRSFRDQRVAAVVPIAPQGELRYGCFDHGPEANSWVGVTVPSYVFVADGDLPEWRRRPFDRYPATGDRFLTVAAGQTHGSITGARPAPEAVRRLLDLNIALFFHVFLRGGGGREAIGRLAWLEGWTLEQK